jgi:hypothetical protein
MREHPHKDAPPRRARTPAGPALALLTLLSALAAGTVLLLSERISRHADDRLLFAAAIIAALLLSPILWLHYLTLLFAAMAVLRPRLSVAWLVPTAAWLSAQQGSVGGHPWLSVLALSILALTLAAAAAPWIMTPRTAFPTRFPMFRKEAG